MTEKMQPKTLFLTGLQIKEIRDIHLEALGSHKETRTLTQSEVIRDIIDAGISALRGAR